MANHASSKKAIRKIETRTARNRTRVSRIRTFIKKVELLLTEGKKTDAAAALHEAESEIMRGVSKGVIQKNTASRKISRLSKRVKGLAAA
jgi:small subunit ribosomal protein S20